MLIKGVNKRIIEVTHSENDCFDRIILFVNPNYTLDNQNLSKKAGDCVKDVTKKVRLRQKIKRRIFLFVELITSAAIGAMATIGFIKFL